MTYKLKINGLLKNNIITIKSFNKNLNKINQIEKKSEIKLPEYPFQIGEKLKYGIYSAGLKIGDAVITYLGFREINGQMMSLVMLEARAPGFYDLEKIYGDIENYTPVRVEREIRLFREKIFITEEYNQKNNEVIITRKSKNTEIKRIKSKENISNVILLLYHFRYKKNYKIGDRLKFNLPTKRLDMLVDKKIEIKIPLGNFESIFVRSIPSHSKLWLRNDKDCLPLRIQGAIGFGNMYLALIEIE